MAPHHQPPGLGLRAGWGRRGGLRREVRIECVSVLNCRNVIIIELREEEER